MSEWISVEERLPDDMDAEVTVDALAYEDGVIHQAFYDKSSGVWIDTDGDELHGEVTHWMPLPEPPK